MPISTHTDPRRPVFLGNTHAADHTILVPVYIGDEHLFTVSAKAHQADIGNSVPTTYHAAAKDVYEEGGLVFPCVRVQRNYQMNEDIIRMCRARIRVPEQWYGDFLAGLGSARVGERRLQEMCAKFGKPAIKQFVIDWLNYSEERMAQAIRKLPKGRIVTTSKHDAMEPFLPDGIPVKVVLDVDPEQALIQVDLRDNIDCVDCGLNESEASTLSNTLIGVFNNVDADIPHNAGSFRRVKVHLRDNCVVGRPAFPHSCSLATSNTGERLANATQVAFAELGDGYGLAESGFSMGVGLVVVSGRDFRRNGAPYVNQLFVILAGGPGGPQADGWVNFCQPSVSGVLYTDSVELVELKHPLEIKSIRLLTATGGAGRFRGAPASEAVLGPKRDPMTAIIPCDGQHTPARGAQGGHDGVVAATFLISGDGHETQLPNIVHLDVQPGEWIRGLENSGAGYGDPLQRDPQRVLHDVLEKWETLERARDIYGVEFTGSVEDESLVVDLAGTEQRRTKNDGRSRLSPRE